MAEKKKKIPKSALTPLGGGSDIGGRSPKYTELSFSKEPEAAPAPEPEPKRPVGRPRKYVEGAAGESRADRLKSWSQRDVPVRKSLFQGASYGVSATERNIQRTGTAVRGLGSSIRSVPFGSTFMGMIQAVGSVFVMAWTKMSTTMKWLIAIAFFVAILFVPWGLFYFVGWAVAAAVMYLVSLIYWIFANLFNGIASGIIAVINGVATIFMGFIIWIVESIMGFFIPPKNNIPYQWTNGRGLMENSLIKYTQVMPGNIPALLTPVAPTWQPWFNTTLIAKLFEHIPGLQAFANAMNDFINNSIGKAFSDLAGSSPAWIVVIVGLLPIIAVILVIIAIYLKNKQYLQQ
jgi:hypothetical protein